MDNLCHALAGAAIAHAGFSKRLPRATLLGIVAANIPDVDALTYLFGGPATAVAFRRGWTHGILAVAVWAVLLAALFALWERRRPTPSRDRPHGAPGMPGWRDFLPLALIAVCSHPALDWLNSYGVRFLMPFSDRWFYGDAIFIVDPVLLALFGLGWFVSSRAQAAGSARSHVPARVALALVLLYVGAMKAMSAATASAAESQLGLGSTSARQLMVEPRPLSWRERVVAVNTGATYDHYLYHWRGLGPGAGERGWQDTTGADPAVIAAVRATRNGGRFLRWARFPYFVVGTGVDSGTVFVGDARYSSGTVASWAGIRVHVPIGSGVARP